jgi:transposase
MERNNSRQLWSIDECHFSDNIGPIQYYSLIGEKRKIECKKKDPTRYTLLLAISNDGDYDFGLLNGSCIRKDFREFVEQLPGDVICDNAPIHRNLAIDKLIYIPPYSPQFNPVEMAFSVVKGKFRKEHMIEDVTDRILVSLKELNKHKIERMFRHVDDYINVCNQHFEKK